MLKEKQDGVAEIEQGVKKMWMEFWIYFSLILLLVTVIAFICWYAPREDVSEYMRDAKGNHSIYYVDAQAQRRALKKWGRID